MSVAWAETLGAIWESALDLVYPTRCVACDRMGVGCFCEACRNAVLPIAPPYCERCGEPEAAGICARCRERKPAFAAARFCGRFEDPLRLAVHGLKYERRERLAEPLGELLARAWEDAPELHSAQAVLPLPIHQKREGDRGFNQSALLAKQLGLKIGLPILEKILTRPLYRRPQVGLGREDRQANVEGVFEVARPEQINDCALLLIDDVLTTGSTCHEAAKTLLASGARAVYVLALARETRLFV